MKDCVEESNAGSRPNDLSKQEYIRINMSKGAKKLRLYIRELGGEAELDDLETVLTAVPACASGKLESIINELEELGDVERIDEGRVRLTGQKGRR